MDNDQMIHELQQENAALRSIILYQGSLDEAHELEKFKIHALRHYPKSFADGWNEDRKHFNNAGLRKRWLGWLDCARSRKVVDG